MRGYYSKDLTLVCNLLYKNLTYMIQSLLGFQLTHQKMCKSWYFNLSLKAERKIQCPILRTDRIRVPSYSQESQLDWTTGCPDIWSKFVWVCLWGCFWMLLTSELVEWAKVIVLLDVSGLIQSVEVLERTEELIFLSLQLAECRLWNLLAFIIAWATSLYYIK